MKFQFCATDPCLTRSLQQDGCGLTALQLAPVTTWQTDLSFEFCYHIGYHGKGAQHYVYVREAGSIQKTGCSRVMITSGETENDGKLRKPMLAAAAAVVAANQALFLQIANTR